MYENRHPVPVARHFSGALWTGRGSSCGMVGGGSSWAEKAECPVRRSQTEVGAPFGAFKADRSTTGRSTGISLRLDQFTSPVAFTSSSRNWALWSSGRCRFSGHAAGKPTAHPSCHQFTLTRLPVPFEGWCQSEPLSCMPVGVACNRRVLHHCSVFAPRPEGRQAARLPHRLARFPERACRSSWPHVPRGDRSTRLDLAPRPVARCRCRLPVVRVSPGGAVRTRSEVAVNSVLVPIPLRLVSNVGRAEAPSSSLRLACALRNNDQ